MPHGIIRAESRRAPYIDIATGITTAAATDLRFRTPEPADGAALWQLAKASGALEVNSPYSYILLSDHFADTCVIAELGGKPAGFVSAFISPARQDTVFVWQIGVAPAARGRGLAKSLLAALLERPGCADVQFLEATVTPSNRASEALFRGFARDLGARCEIDTGYPEEIFPGAGHETERCWRIGPLPGVTEH